MKEDFLILAVIVLLIMSRGQIKSAWDWFKYITGW